MNPEELIQTEKKAPLTDQVLSKVDSLIMQSESFKNLVHRLRDVLGIYNPNIGSSATQQSNMPDVPVTPTISDAARRMTKLIKDNEEILVDFENLLKNL